MSSVKWTDDQLRAIESRGSSLLVSAAAGSGKTAVLVERLLRRITEEGRDITEFLIITYTKAAASELRKKISEALYERAAADITDKHIRRQLALVANARISTVHSFCTWILKNYEQTPEFAGGFRLLDEAEGKMILDELLDELIEEKYDEKSESFIALSEYMSPSRSDVQMVSSVRELFEKSLSHPYPERWLSSVAKMYKLSDISDICDTVWGSSAKKEADARLDELIHMMKLLCADISQDAVAQGIYGDFLYAERKALEDAKKSDWDEMYLALSSLEFAHLPSSRGVDDKTIPERIKAIRARVKKVIGDILEKTLGATSDVLISELKHLSPYVSELTKLAGEVSARFTAEKLRRGVLDYSDLEHHAIRLLVEKYDARRDIVVPSETAREISKNFCEILLDEFQDSNNIQDIIFRAVSRDEKNIVMVGDVKQSIYSFRLADPSIFMKKYKKFKRYEKAQGDEPRYITLSKNFRSRGEVIDSVNSTFSGIMSEELGGINYTKRQRLVPRDNIPEAEGKEYETEFILLDRADGNEAKAKETEALFVAKKIRTLVDTGFEIFEKDGTRRRVTYGDFAILLRSSATNAEFYEKALASYGIPYISPRAEGLLQKVEISVMVSMLSVIDNPMSDIPLLSVLRSPLFAYTADDLCEIRSSGDDSIYDAMRALSKGEGDAAKKCREFLAFLSELRGVAQGMPADRLIWEIYNRTNALGLFGAMKNGRLRQKNLLEFYKCARDFEKSGYHGLYKFLSHIVKLHERGADISSSPSYVGDSVNIMTIHKSKGLEFPIVFLGNSIRNFNLDDIKGPVLIHPKFGIGLRYHDDARLGECSTLAREVISRAITDEMRSEELRLLYVAMTRARDKLYIISSNDNAARMIAKRLEENPYKELFSDTMRNSFSTLSWLILPLLKSSSGAPLYYWARLPFSELGDTYNMKVSVISSAECVFGDMEKGDEEKLEEKIDTEKLIERFSFIYPCKEAEKAPSKVTATELSAAVQGESSRRRSFARPRFLREKKLNAAERGIALHMAMQFADFRRCTDVCGAEGELLRLLGEKYLTQAQYEAVPAERIAEFVNSDIGKRMLSAKSVMREFKFSVLLPADEMLGSEELSGEDVLLQGVMDMYFEDEDGITILDFKTDAAHPDEKRFKKYSEQLRLYARAFFEMTGKRATRLVLYLASRGETIEI